LCFDPREGVLIIFELRDIAYRVELDEAVKIALVRLKLIFYIYFGPFRV
jgi:hypothetical protein